MSGERRDEDVPLCAVRGPGALHVLLVAPGHDRGALHELLGGGRLSAGTASAPGSARVLGHEARAVPGHRRALRQRVEHSDAGEVVELQRRRRRLVEPQLAVGLVRGEHEAVRARGRRGARRRRAVPSRPWGCSDSSPTRAPSPSRPRRRRRVRAGSPPRSGSSSTRAGKARASLGDGITRLRDRARRHRGPREQVKIASLLPRVGTICVRIEGDAEPSLDPGCDRLAQLRQACRRIAHARRARLLQRGDDFRIRRLLRVTGAEVDHLEALRFSLGGCLVEAHERSIDWARRTGRSPCPRLACQEPPNFVDADERCDLDLLVACVRVPRRARPEVDCGDAPRGEVRHVRPCLLGSTARSPASRSFCTSGESLAGAAAGELPASSSVAPSGSRSGRTRPPPRGRDPAHIGLRCATARSGTTLSAMPR